LFVWPKTTHRDMYSSLLCGKVGDEGEEFPGLREKGSPEKGTKKGKVRNELTKPLLPFNGPSVLGGIAKKSKGKEKGRDLQLGQFFCLTYFRKRKISYAKRKKGHWEREVILPQNQRILVRQGKKFSCHYNIETVDRCTTKSSSLTRWLSASVGGGKHEKVTLGKGSHPWGGEKEEDQESWKSINARLRREDSSRSELGKRGEKNG